MEERCKHTSASTRPGLVWRCTRKPHDVKTAHLMKRMQA